MKVKVSEATKNQLNWMVAKCLYPHGGDEWWSCISVQERYSTDWSQGGPIIAEKIDCLRKRSKAEEAGLANPNPGFKFKAEIFADIDGYFCAFGPTPLIAGLRCVVMSELGDEVDVPEELK